MEIVWVLNAQLHGDGAYVTPIAIHGGDLALRLAGGSTAHRGGRWKGVKTGQGSNGSSFHLQAHHWRFGNICGRRIHQFIERGTGQHCGIRMMMMITGSVDRSVDREIRQRSTGVGTKKSFSFKNQAKRPSQLRILEAGPLFGQLC